MLEISPASMRPPPDLAAALFQLYSNFNALEAVLYASYADMMDDNGSIAEAVLSRIDSISHKVSVIFDTARLKSELPTAAALLRHEANVREAITYRNLVAHSLYVWNEEGTEVALVANIFRTGRGPVRDEPLRLTDVNKHGQSLANAMRELSPLCRSDRVSVRGYSIGRIV